MFEIKIGDETYEFSCKLGVTKKIKQKFQKPFNVVIGEISEYDVPELIKFLYAALITEMDYKDFEKLIYDNLGVMELTEHVILLIKKLQYPTLSEEEIDKKLEEQKNA